MADTVFLTGGAGLLALNWAMAVRNSHHVVLGLHERQVAPQGVWAQPARLDSVEEIARALDDVQPHVVVHTAGLTSVERCEADPALARRVNVDLSVHVATACARLGVPLVHISTDHLFSGDEALLDESEPVAPRNVYGRTKADAETGVLAAHPTALVVRTNFYAWGPSYRRSFSDGIIISLRSGRPITLFEDVHYTPILVEALAQAVHELLDLGATGIVHVTGDERVSKAEFGRMAAEMFGLDTNLIRVGVLADKPALVQRPRDMSLSNGAVRRLLRRALGGPREQLARLYEQDRAGHAREIQAL